MVKRTLPRESPICIPQKDECSQIHFFVCLNHMLNLVLLQSPVDVCQSSLKNSYNTFLFSNKFIHKNEIKPTSLLYITHIQGVEHIYILVNELRDRRSVPYRFT